MKTTISPVIPNLSLMTPAEVRKLKAFYAKNFSTATAHKLCAYVDALNALAMQVCQMVRQGVDVASGMTPDDIHAFTRVKHKAQLEQLHVFKLVQALQAAQHKGLRTTHLRRGSARRVSRQAKRAVLYKSVEAELQALSN